MKKILAFFLCLLLLLTACGQSAPETSPVTEAVSETTGAPETAPATQAPETEPTEPAVILHSGLREDGTFNEGTLFIGDSMTCILVQDYLTPMGLIGDASYMGKYGAQITAFFGGVTMDTNVTVGKCAYRPEHEGMTYEEIAIALGDRVTAIYMMFGTNYTYNAYADMYIELVDFLLETCPNATVYLQLIPHGNEEIVRYKIVNPWIREAYAHYVDQGQTRVQLIDTFTAIGINHDEGWIHLNSVGNENWYNAIVDYAKANNIPE